MTSDARLCLSAVLITLACVALTRATPVPQKGPPASAAPVRSVQATTLRDGLRLDPNLATAGDLELLPGVGPSLAARIIEARRTAGPFQTATDLLRVRGVGRKTLARLTPFLRFERGRPTTSKNPLEQVE